MYYYSVSIGSIHTEYYHTHTYTYIHDIVRAVSDVTVLIEEMSVSGAPLYEGRGPTIPHTHTHVHTHPVRTLHTDKCVRTYRQMCAFVLCTGYRQMQCTVFVYGYRRKACILGTIKMAQPPLVIVINLLTSIHSWHMTSTDTSTTNFKPALDKHDVEYGLPVPSPTQNY